MLLDQEDPPIRVENIGGRGGGKDGGSGGEEAPNTLKSKQTARVIDLLSEGPIKGVVGGAKGVYFDGVVVRRADGTYNFKDASLQFVTGVPAQAVMPGFTSAEAETGVNQPLVKKNPPLVRHIASTDVDRARITVSVPSLQSGDKETGDIDGTSVQFRIEISNNGGGYAKIGDYTISGKTNSNYQRAYTLTLPRPGPWDLRLTRLTADADVVELQNALNWDSYTEITDDKVNYTNSACVGTIIDAEQFRSIPKRTYDVEGLYIYYPSNMDPATGLYTGAWNGNFLFGYCNNPAWVLYDLITNGRYGIGDYIPASMVDKWSFYKAGVWCDGYVFKNGKSGIKERRYVCNIRITNQQEAFDLLQQMSSIFRGFSYWSGGQLVLVADQPEDPTDIFTNANVIDGMFTYSGTDRRERHTQILVSWQDPKQLGETRWASVEDRDGISRYGLLQDQEEGFGCTAESQAIRAGKWTLYTELYEDDGIVFSTGLQGSYLRPGSIIKVMDASIAGRRRGGRVGLGTTYNHIVFDDPIYLYSGRTYYMNCVIVTDEDTASVQSRSFAVAATGPAAFVNISSGFSKPPLPDQLFVITETTLEATLWRVMTVKQTERDQYQINGVKHYPTKFDYVEKDHAISEPDVTDIVAKPPNVTNAKVFEYILQTSAVSLQVMATFSWTSLSPLFDVFYHRGNDNWTHIRTDQHAINIPVTAGVQYTFQVTPIGTLGIKGGMTEVKATFVGLTAPPATPQQLRVNTIEGVALFDWLAATEIDVKIGGRYELRFSPVTSGVQWNTAQVVIPSIPGTATSVESNYQTGTWLLRVFDIDGRPSPGWASIVALAADLRYIQYTTICESPDFTGTHNGTEIKMPQEWLVLGATGGLWDNQLDNMSTWPDVDLLPVQASNPREAGQGYYTFARLIDAGAPFSVRLAVDILAFPFYINSDTIDERAGLVDTWTSWDDATTGLAGQVTILIRSTLDDPASSSATWSEWVRFVTGEHYARAWQFQALLEAPEGQNIGVEKLCITADLRAKIDAGENVPYSASETRIYFRIKFYNPPAVVVTLQLAMAEDRVEILHKTNEYFEVKITQTSTGTNPIGLRDFDWHAQGY